MAAACTGACLARATKSSAVQVNVTDASGRAEPVWERGGVTISTRRSAGCMTGLQSTGSPTRSGQWWFQRRPALFMILPGLVNELGKAPLIVESPLRDDERVPWAEVQEQVLVGHHDRLDPRPLREIVTNLAYGAQPQLDSVTLRCRNSPLPSLPL